MCPVIVIINICDLIETKFAHRNTRTLVEPFRFKCLFISSSFNVQSGFDVFNCCLMTVECLDLSMKSD